MTPTSFWDLPIGPSRSVSGGDWISNHEQVSVIAQAHLLRSALEKLGARMSFTARPGNSQLLF